MKSHIATGAFLTGNMTNGLMWRGDEEGQWGASYTIHIPEIPGHVDGSAPIDIPITAGFTNTVYSGISLADVHYGFEISPGVPLLTGVINSVTLAPVTATGPAVSFNIGIPGGSTKILIPATFSVGPADWTVFNIPAQTGYFNTTTNPSSGFFNSGPGTVSGFGNVGANLSGFQNYATAATSGFKNYGNMQSGLANLGDTVSGLLNTGIGTPANVSGAYNIGTNLAGFFHNQVAGGVDIQRGIGQRRRQQCGLRKCGRLQRRPR